MERGWNILGTIVTGLRYLLIAPIWLYRKLISPLIPARCIYTPSCSLYAIEAIRHHGIRGLLLSLARVFRCVGGLYEGGDDPVPEEFSFKAIGEGYRKHWHGRNGAE